MACDCHILTCPDHPWGDYGEILLHGMSSHLARKGDLIRLERTGPFVPPITFPGPGDVVVVDSLRAALESTPLTGLAFRPVVKQRIVRLDWHLWPQDAEDPAEFPESGEPEDYILERRHSLLLARRIGKLWELTPPVAAGIDRSDGQIRLVIGEAAVPDFFRAEGVGYFCVSNRARDWLEDSVPEWVAFEEPLFAEH